MRSIRRHLLGWILGALCAGSLVLVVVSYFFALDEMNEIFDENLKQVALAVASHRAFNGDAPRRRAELPELAPVYEAHGRFDFVTATWTRDGRPAFVSEPGVALPFSDRDGPSDVSAGDEHWHVYTLVLPDGVVQAAQRASAREALAAEAASKLFVPLVVLIALTGVLLTAALRHGLRPLDQEADRVAARSAASLEPIDARGLPREIHPLIGSINGLMQRLAGAFDAQRRFVADAAHELRSPVTALRLQLQLLERAKTEAERDSAEAGLKAAVDRAQRLIEQLLSLSRVEPDAPEHPLQPLDLGALAREAVARHSGGAEHDGVDLGADAGDDVVANADRHQIEVLLDNLIGNAIRHAGPGGRVDVRAAQVDGHPVLDVVDDGPGIPEAERERVFDRFYRGQNAKRSTGSGLGLAIVRAIAQRHGASVSLHTPASGKGLDVRVEFAA